MNKTRKKLLFMNNGWREIWIQFRHLRTIEWQNSLATRRIHSIETGKKHNKKIVCIFLFFLFSFTALHFLPSLLFPSDLLSVCVASFSFSSVCYSWDSKNGCCIYIIHGLGSRCTFCCCFLSLSRYIHVCIHNAFST